MPAGESSRRRPRAERRDAVENRGKILRTAADLMALRGYNVPLSEIADAAGVGVGTFYRAFPDRAGLLEELQRRGYELLLTILGRIKADGLTGADAVEAKVRIGEAIGDFLAEGRADGSVYADVAAIDVIVCGTLIALPLPHGPDWAAAAQRHLTLFIRGIRKHSGQPVGKR